MQEWHEMAVYEYSHVIGEVDGAADYLRYLHDSGVKLGLATANSKGLYEPVMKRLGIYGLFDKFATTEEVERGKGFPDVYELACERLGEAPEDAIVFEDIIEGIRGAKLGGFSTAACLYEARGGEAETLTAEADIAFADYRRLMA